MTESKISERNPALMMSGDELRKIMNAKGPTVKAVVLCVDGTMIEVDYNSTPKDRHVEQFIQGSPTIIGEYSDIQVIIVKNIDDSNKAVNPHKLKYPFNNLVIKGNIFMYRFNEACQTVDFTLNEYKEFLAIEAKMDDNNENNNDNNDTSNNDNNNDTNNNDSIDENIINNYNEERQVDVEKMLIPVLKRQFKEKTGRDISDEELEVLKQKALSQFGAFGGGGGCCGDDHEHEHHGHDGHEHGNEAVIHFDPAIVPILQKQFRDRHGREARNDELQELLDIMADALDSFGTVNDHECCHGCGDHGGQHGSDVSDGDEHEHGITETQMENIRNAMQGLDKQKRLELQNMIKQKYIQQHGNSNIDVNAMNEAFKVFNIDTNDDEKSEVNNDDNNDDNNDNNDDSKNDMNNYSKAVQIVRELAIKDGKILMENMDDKLKEYGIQLTRDEMKKVINEVKISLQNTNKTSLNQYEVSFLNALNAQANIHKVVLNQAKHVLFNDLRYKAIIQWKQINGNKMPKEFEINNIIKQLSLNLFDNFMYEQTIITNESNNNSINTNHNNSHNCCDNHTCNDDQKTNPTNIISNNNNNNKSAWNNQSKFDDFFKMDSEVIKAGFDNIEANDDDDEDSEYLPSKDKNDTLYQRDMNDDDNYDNFVVPNDEDSDLNNDAPK